MGKSLKSIWLWMTTSKYTRYLETENERLRDEVTQLTNSCLSFAGMPQLVKHASKPGMPIQGRLMPSQMRRAYQKQDARNHIVPEA